MGCNVGLAKCVVNSPKRKTIETVKRSAVAKGVGVVGRMNR